MLRVRHTLPSNSNPQLKYITVLTLGLTPFSRLVHCLVDNITVLTLGLTPFSRLVHCLVDPDFFSRAVAIHFLQGVQDTGLIHSGLSGLIHCRGHGMAQSITLRHVILKLYMVIVCF